MRLSCPAMSPVPLNAVLASTCLMNLQFLTKSVLYVSRTLLPPGVRVAQPESKTQLSMISVGFMRDSLLLEHKELAHITQFRRNSSPCLFFRELPKPAAGMLD